MKFSLALVASMAYAVKVDDLMDDLEDAVSVTLYDDMTWSAEYGDWDYDWDYDWEDDWDYEWEDDWDSWEDDWDYDWEDDWYVDEWCDEEWHWEDCSEMSWRYPCEFELEGDGWGWIYWDDWSYEEFWVSGDDYSNWESCNGGAVEEWCDNEWIWEDCSESWWRNPCDWEGQDGWVYWDDWYGEGP